MSNRDIQPFQFACPKCEEKISFVFGRSDAELKGATEVIGFKAPFQGDNPFIDLHLDFPVSFGKYEMGNTAFFKAIHELGQDSFSDLSLRLSMLNELHTKRDDLQRLIVQYIRNDISSFDEACKTINIPSIKLKSHKKEDLLAALYSATSAMSSPFTIHEHNKELSNKVPDLLRLLHTTNTEMTLSFFDKIISSDFLKNLHHDCLHLYPKMLGFDLPLRPALYYDYIELNNIGSCPARVSTAEFDTCNNFYKDLAEVFSRQLIIVAGLNNLLKRGDCDLFHDSVRYNKRKDLIKNFSSLDNFAKVDLGSKLDAIDDSFYQVDIHAIDNELRNGIAHYKYEYKESTQSIKFYPKKDGLQRTTFKEMQFIAFMRKLLLLFREVHSLNHIMKALNYYSIFILKIRN